MKNSIIPLIFLIQLFLDPQIVKAQNTTPTITTTPTPTTYVTPDLDPRFNAIESQITLLATQIQQDPSNSINNLISTLSLFATVLLGAITIIGGLVIWNSVETRKEAQRNLHAIRRSNDEAAKILAIFRSKADETVKFADEQIKKITQYSDEAVKHTASIKQKDSTISDLVSQWESKRDDYNQVSLGTASLSPSASIQSPSYGTNSITLPESENLYDYLKNMGKPSQQVTIKEGIDINKAK